MDERTFRDAMGKFATGVTVITTLARDKVHGMTANAMMSVSLNPKLILVSIDEKAHMLEKINQSGRFAISILSEQQKDISMHFAGQFKRDEVVDFDWFHGLPVIKDCLANIVCRVYQSHPAGDHTLFLGEVEDILIRDGTPLTFYEGKYRKISG
ncbi:flavin reductase family protein [Camelliibacillus cellulosilyticus]|uniref:Flavin reductase family protein n=1 Tax=Camelliibacillus cellulosilyticus TaxID=2174486 RepID=A0ABV9GIU4_9BACL